MPKLHNSLFLLFPHILVISSVSVSDRGCFCGCTCCESICARALFLLWVCISVGWRCECAMKPHKPAREGGGACQCESWGATMRCNIIAWDARCYFENCMYAPMHDTVAILAQGTYWAVAVMQAFFTFCPGFKSPRCRFRHRNDLMRTSSPREDSCAQN